MTNGIYGYYDTKNQYVVYIGQDSYINEEKRHREHLSPSMYDRQHINRILQNNPSRYIYFNFVEGNYTQDEIDNFEKEAIKLFKTYKYDYPKRNVFNFTPGGDIIPSRIPEIAKKISESISGENNPSKRKEVRDKQSKAVLGDKNPSKNEKVRLKMSKTKNTLGYYNVSKRDDKSCKQGYIFIYRYIDKNGKRKSLSSVDIKVLEQKVRAKNLKWKKFD